MENKHQETVSPMGANGGVVLSPDNAAIFGDVPEDLSRDSDALSLNPRNTEPVNSPRSTREVEQPFWHFARRISLILLAIVALGLLGIFLATRSSKQQYNNATNSSYSPASSSLASRFGTINLPLSGFVSSKNLSVSGSPSVTINGSAQLNDGLIVTPSLQPAGAKPGQIYYDQSTNQLAYYNGQNFVFLTAAGPTGLQSLGGATGQLALGSGLTLSSGKLANSGVLSVQGQNGAVLFTAGAGIVINGTSFSNAGVLSITSGSPNVSVSGTGTGNVTISLNGNGTGTVTSSGGASGAIPVYTASQDIENSIITQTGSDINVGGDLTLDDALTVTNGGTGTTTLPADGVLVGNNTTPVSSLVAGGAGLCLLSTSGAPTWAVCPGGNPNVVTSLNTLSGDLSIADATAAGSTITIDNATTSTEGIASFNASNFTVTSGSVNTIQNISTASNPTFAGVTTAAITPTSGLTVGAQSQALTLQGSASTVLTATNAGDTSTLAFASPTGNVTYTLPAGSGSYNVCTSAGNCLGGSGGANTSLSNLSSVAINTSLLPGATTINLGSSAAPFNNLYLGGSATDNFEFTGTASAARTITIPDASGTLALSASGNIALSAAGNITFTGQLPIANGGTNATTAATARSNLGAAASGANSDITSLSGLTTALSVLQGGTGATTAANARTNLGAAASGANSDISSLTALTAITPTSTLTVGSTSQTLILQGGASTVLTATNGSDTTTLSFASPTGDATYTLPTASGSYNICTSSGNCLGGSGGANTALSNLTSVAINTSLLPGATTIDLGSNASPFRNLYLGGSATDNFEFTGTATAARTITIPDATGTICLTTGNCLGGGSGGANTSLSNLSSVAINTSLLPGATTINLGSSAAPFNNLYLGGSATDNFEFTGTASAARTITIPDASGTLALSASGNIALSAAGNITFTGQLPIANGGTNATTAATARSNLGAAASGANSDITSLSGLTTALSVLQGGTGATSLNTDGILYGGGTSAISATAAGTTGQCLLANTSAAPTWGSCSGGVTLQGAYNNSSSPASIVTTSSSKGILFQAGSGDDSTSLFEVQGSSAVLLNVDSVNSVVDIGASGTPTQSGSNLYVGSADFSGAILIGSSSNNVQFSGSTFEPTLSGTARHTEVIMLTAEYAGAVLDAGSGSNNTGTMTSDIDATNRENYFQWTTNQSSSQSYDVVVQVPIPSGFSAWASTTPLTIAAETSDTTHGTIELEVLDSNGTVEPNANFASITPTSTNTWQTITAGSFSGTYTAGGYMTLRIRMFATSAVSDVRIGNIKLTYLSKF